MSTLRKLLLLEFLVLAGVSRIVVPLAYAASLVVLNASQAIGAPVSTLEESLTGLFQGFAGDITSFDNPTLGEPPIA